MTDDRLVLVMVTSSANDAVRGQMRQYSNALTEIGLQTLEIEANDAELEYAAGLMSQGLVRFAFTWLGLAQDFSGNDSNTGRPVNLWEHYRVPLLKLQGDLPAYFVQRHADQPRNSVNLYGPREFIDFRTRWLSSQRALTALIPPLPLDACKRSVVDLTERRNGRLVFLKNGNSPQELQELWNRSLPGPVARLLLDAAQEAIVPGTSNGRFDIGDFAESFLGSRGISVSLNGFLVMLFAAQIDDYLRRVKSRMIAEALLDFPVIVQGSFWHHLDFAGRKARLLGGASYEQSQHAYRHELGVIDMSPNVDTSPHERAQRAAGSFSLLITNRQSWIVELSPDFAELCYEFNKDSIADRISRVLADPDHYLELGVAYGAAFQKQHTSRKFAEKVVELADLARLQYGTEQPTLQSFCSLPYLD